MRAGPDRSDGHEPREIVQPEATPALENRGHGDTPPLDIERYRRYLDGMNLSETQEREMLQALWSVLSAFVDLAFGVDSVHLARPQVKDEAEASSHTDNAAEPIESAHQPGNHVAKEVKP
jgi:hypothetical protein